jgi:hypothetical protein
MPNHAVSTVARDRLYGLSGETNPADWLKPLLAVVRHVPSLPIGQDVPRR